MSCGVMTEHMGCGVMEEVWRKGPWTSEEDRLLNEYVKLYGEGRWNSVGRLAGLKRNGKSCRLRWVNYLRPDLKRGKMTPHEESIILELHAKLGNRWSTIAQSLPGRTDNEIKNYWRTQFKKKPKIFSDNTEKSKSCLTRKQQLQQQQQQQQLNHVDAKKIVSLLDESENKVSTQPQVRQDMATTAEEQGFFYSMFNDYGFVPEDSNEDFLWSDLWNLDNFHGNLASSFY